MAQTKGVKETEIATPGMHTSMVWRRNLAGCAGCYSDDVDAIKLMTAGPPIAHSPITDSSHIPHCGGPLQLIPREPSPLERTLERFEQDHRE